MKAILYTRSLCDDQYESKEHLLIQEDYLKHYCDQNEIQILRSYSDICGSNELKKPGYDQMFKDLESKVICPDLLVCLNPSRLSRDFKMHLKIYLKLKKMGVMVKFAEEISNNDPYDSIYGNFMDSLIVTRFDRLSRNILDELDLTCR